MSRITSKQKRELAQYLFVDQGLSQAEIASWVGTSETQVSRWKRKYDWDKLRSARSLTRDQLIANAYEQADLIYKVAKEEKRPVNSKEADILVKLSVQIKNLDKELNAQSAMTVFKHFNEFLIREGQLETAKQLTEHERVFVINLMQPSD